MTQIAQLSESEIEDQFHIVGNRAIAFTLDGYVRNGAQFSVNFGDQMYLTRLLQVLPDQGVLIFDCSGSETINRQLLASTRCSFVGRPEGIHVQFMGNAERAEWLEADVFQALRDFRKAGKTFDLIVLDPPKFAPSAAHAEPLRHFVAAPKPLFWFQLTKPCGQPCPR